MSARRAAIGKAREKADARRLNPLEEFIWEGRDKRGKVMKGEQLARNANLYSHQRLVEAARARGHEIDVLNTLRVTMNITSHRPEAFYQGNSLPAYDAVIPRIGASITFYGLAVLRQFEMMGVWSLNESVAIGRSRDKLRSMQILSRAGLGMPVTAFAHDPKQTDEVLRMVGGAPVTQAA